MKTYKVIVSKAAVSDLDSISSYVTSLYRPESGHKYVNRILGQLASLSYTADIYPSSRFATAKAVKRQNHLHNQPSMDDCFSHRRPVRHNRPHHSIQNDGLIIPYHEE